ncbi:hypothetical protein H7J88_28355 [Mycolicibacterium flavescens]|uniref:Uncharacterized protein n=1 Tax=Mycolicibacterium flavescens TaxID=1776 RepID=A0A1E3RB64_MYCFV|nr:hypothetical protein [Mycolicibacterium flavescens]MCV7283555.1 hypothetical protein [Mycolicibacterium flavescens]ODQ87114.1 hypothetical protein BHQ18_24975 [Mycolicibacterium flavescens]
MVTEPERDVQAAEERAREARDRAARAGLSAAESFERSARLHEELAGLQQDTASRGIPAPEVNLESSARHREAAQEDRTLAHRKREESEADLNGPV